MGIVQKVMKSSSKYNKSLPYTYLAKLYIIEGDEDLCHYFYGDTICSLIAHLEKENISPEEVHIYSLYDDKEIELKKDIFTSEENDWLLKPYLCRALEDHYHETKDELYKGHCEDGECSFEDRDETII
ncbi:MAG: hypothetical protein GY936_15105 [Ignavibacteriae bacterium]|nr:hypothetical protein [Ignavibacteriota bacterium]